MADKPNPIQLQRFLTGLDYPASRDDLVRHAASKGADEPVPQNPPGDAGP